MALKNILETIKKEAEEKVEDIEKENRKKIEALEQELNQKLTEEKTELILKAKKGVQNKIAQATYQLTARTKSQMLRKKQELIDLVFNKALDKLKLLTDEQYLKVISGLINKLPETAKAVMTPAHGRENLTKKALRESARNYSLASKSIASNGGFVLESAQFNIDNRFENLLKQLRPEIETEVSKILFD